MTLNVKLFARAKDLAGRDELPIEVSRGMTVRDARRALVEACPALSGFIDRCLVAVGNEFASDDQEVKPDDEVALLPPVSGG